MSTEGEQPEAGPSSSPSSSPTLLPLPLLDVRWVHAGAQHLDLLPTPITALNPAYKSFSADESERIEEAWLELPEEDRRRAVAEWGSLEGEGAPAKNKTKEKEKDKAKEEGVADKDKDKDQRDRSRSPKNVRSIGLRTGEVQDRLDGKMPEKEDVYSGREQTNAEEGDSKYKDIIRKIQRSPDLEKIQGVPVSQVSGDDSKIGGMLMAGLDVRGLFTDIITASGLLGTLGTKSTRAARYLVCGR